MSGLVFGPKDAVRDVNGDYIELAVPCGQCFGCRLDRSRSWAMRCVHEARSHEKVCFLTLTLADDNQKSLDKKQLQDFFKRLRKKIEPRKIRYMACGEYGEKLGRPHYHVILFGEDFKSDRKFYRFSAGSKMPLYNSDLLSSVWPFGFAVVADFSYDAAAYVARYVMKKITGDMASAHYAGRVPEYIVMSRRPGIGKDFALKFRREILDHDGVYHDGLILRPPRYYDKLFDVEDFVSMYEVKKKREEKAKKFASLYTPEALANMELARKQKFVLFKKGSR